MSPASEPRLFVQYVGLSQGCPFGCRCGGVQKSRCPVVSVSVFFGLYIVRLGCVIGQGDYRFLKGSPEKSRKSAHDI